MNLEIEMQEEKALKEMLLVRHHIGSDGTCIPCAAMKELLIRDAAERAVLSFEGTG